MRAARPGRIGFDDRKHQLPGLAPERHQCRALAVARAQARIRLTEPRGGPDEAIQEIAWRSKVERLITLSTSLVAVWYLSDSSRSPLRSRNSASSRANDLAALRAYIERDDPAAGSNVP
jgi:hypothetical protein